MSVEATQTETEILLPELEFAFEDAIEFAGKTYNSIVLREPKAREVQQALAALGSQQTPDSLFKYNTTLISSVSGVSPKVVEQMPLRQFNAASRYLERFLSDTGQ